MASLKLFTKRAVDVTAPIFILCWFLLLGIHPRMAEPINVLGHKLQGDLINIFLVLTIPFVILSFIWSLFLLRNLIPYQFIRLEQFRKEHPLLLRVLVIFPAALYAIYLCISQL